jgi:anionic cell wall polymer biosynthesis LytR-Cps2A-Psr (LCP) family protein
MLNKNLDLNISDFITIDFNGLAEVINLMGGIDIDVQEDEIQWINGYQEEGSQVTGLDIVPVTYAGEQTLNGLQALSYCRIRYT